jgi:magnesium chelatase family protein
MRIAAPLNTEPNPILQWVEVSCSRQLPSFHIIGLPSPEVAEARERVRAAIEASGFEFPKSRIVLNLSPASVRKRGTGLDLAIALAILISSPELEQSDHRTGTAVAWGELGLDGSVKSVSQLTRAIYSTWKAGIPRLIISHEEHAEAEARCRWIESSGEFQGPAPVLIPAASLAEAWEKLSSPSLRSEQPSLPAPPLPEEEPELPRLLPLPRSVERAVSVAATGQHHLLLIGPKGAGKSHALEWRGALEPAQSPGSQVRHRLLAELGAGSVSAELTSIRRVSSQVRPQALIGHTVNHVFRPGEFTLADGGLLLADELPEWARDSREALREPLERGKVCVNRVAFAMELPASFTLAATGNLCPCGGWPREKPVPGQFDRGPKTKDRIERCLCRPGALSAYFARLSGPIMDRIDLVTIAWPSVAGRRGSESVNLKASRENVKLARERLITRWGALPGKMPAAKVESLIEEHSDWRPILKELPYTSLRERHKIVRVAMSLAAWDGKDEPDAASFLEAESFRPRALNLGPEQRLARAE